MVRVIPISGEDTSQEKRPDDQQPAQTLPPPGPPVPDQPPSCTQGKCDHNKLSSLDYARFVVEIITLLVLYYYTRITGQALDAAREANRLTGVANSLTVENVRLDQRPWVALGPINVPNKPVANSVLNIKAPVNNSGKSPALHTVIDAVLRPLILAAEDKRVPFVDMSVLSRCAQPKLQWSEDPGGGSILPGANNLTVGVWTPVLKENLVEKITEEGRTPYIKLEDGGWEDIWHTTAPPKDGGWIVRVFFVGCIDYFDEFHESHRTSFCLYYAMENRILFPNGGFTECEKGNEAD